MISLKDYIKKSVIKSNYPKWDENDIYDHFFIEFEMNGCEEFVFEHYGKYDGQIELAQTLSKELYNSYPENDEIITFDINDSDITGFENIFYHKLTVKWGNKIGTGYIPQNNFDIKSQKFKEIIIKIDSYNNSTKKRIFKSLMHELLHAWHDYNSNIFDDNGKLKGKSLITLGSESKYYHNIRKDKPITKPELFAKNLIYLLTKFEGNAYSSEIYGELENCENEILSWKDAWTLFRNSSTYKSILNLYINLQNIQNKSDEFKKDFVNYYNKFMNSSLTLNKIQKKLLVKLNNLFDHIMKNCAKIYYEWSSKKQEEKHIDEGLFVYYDLNE